MSVNLPIYNVKAAKKPVTVTINGDLIRKARSLHIYVSQTLESSLIELVRQKKCEQWVKENKDANAEYNKGVEKEGTLNDGIRKF